MTISATINNFLTEHHITFDVVLHSHTNNAMSSAIASGISPDKVAKAVILEDHESRHLMAIMPASKRIRLRKLNDILHREFHFVNESEIKTMFKDCKSGAIPAIGEAFNLESIVDDTLLEQQEVYFEAGDHRELIHMKNNQFKQIMENRPHSRFSFSEQDIAW